MEAVAEKSKAKGKGADSPSREYPMERTPLLTNRWETLVPVPAERSTGTPAETSSPFRLPMRFLPACPDASITVSAKRWRRVERRSRKIT